MEKTECRQRLSAAKCCVLIPTYNNAGTLGAVVREVLEYADDVLVVNDGSTDNTAEILAQISNIQVLSYLPNAGKGMALRRGFEFARQKGYTHAITIDSDGQHYPKDIPAFVPLLELHPNAIVVGARQRMNKENNVPKKSNFGNALSTFWLRYETGYRLPDTQSGFRLYPLLPLQNIRFGTSRYDFEIEVMVKAAWREVELLSVPIDVYYPPAEERVSHFKPFQDFMRITWLNIKFATLATFFYIPRRWIRSLKKKNIRQRIHEQLFNPKQSNARKAASVGYGIFWGIFPLWGYQLIICIPTSYLLRLNTPLVVIAANISIPPMIPFILYASFITGSFFVENPSTDISLSKMFDWQMIGSHAYQYIVGAIVLAIFAGIFMGLLTYILLSFRVSKYQD